MTGARTAATRVGKLRLDAPALDGVSSTTLGGHDGQRSWPQALAGQLAQVAAAVLTILLRPRAGRMGVPVTRAQRLDHLEAEIEAVNRR
jgi:hypothetical protein